MNSIHLTGRFTRDPELKYAQNGNAYLKFTLAVSRPYASDQTDFINCVAFGKTAELIGTHCMKGHMAGISGSLQVEKFQKKDGGTGKNVCVLVRQFDFLTKKEYRNEGVQEVSWDGLGEEVDLNSPNDDLPF